MVSDAFDECVLGSNEAKGTSEGVASGTFVVLGADDNGRAVLFSKGSDFDVILQERWSGLCHADSLKLVTDLRNASMRGRCLRDLRLPSMILWQ